MGINKRMNGALSCASSDRNKGKTCERNLELIYSDPCGNILKRNEKTQDSGEADSFCFFRCDSYTGDLSFVGDGCSDPKFIPNCLIKRTRTTTVLGGIRKSFYFIHSQGMSQTAVGELVKTEQLLNRTFVKSWHEFTKTKLRSVYQNGGWWELFKWARAYKDVLELADATLWDLIMLR